MKSLLLAVSVATAALAGILFGFDSAVISGVTQDLAQLFSLSNQALGFTVSAALWGTLFGAMTMGQIGDRYGSRNALMVMAIFYVCSGVGSSLSWNWSSLLAFRIIGGIAIGGSSVLAPVYISEIAPARHRGALVGLFQFNIVLGILIAYLSNFLIAGLALGATEWRWKFAVTAVPATVLLVALTRIPHSPRWLVSKGRERDAHTVLQRLGNEDSEAELDQLREAARISRESAEQTLSWRHHRRPILLAIALAAFNQFSGINAILYYANDIFAAAGFSQLSASLQAVAIGGTNLLFTMVAMTVIDRVGRKPLLLIGSVGMACCLAGTGIVQSGWAAPAYLLWMLVGFIGFFAFSQGAVIWVYLSEIFPTAVRARGQSLGSSTHWGVNAAIAWAFPAIAAYSRGGPFFLFAGVMLLQLVVVWRFFPETKRQRLEDIRTVDH